MPANTETITYARSTPLFSRNSRENVMIPENSQYKKSSNPVKRLP